MGLFSSKKKTYVSHTISHIVEEDPKPIKDLLTNHLLTKPEKASDAILNATQDNMGITCIKYFNHTIKSEKLPFYESSYSTTVDPVLLKSILDKINGEPVTLLGSTIDIEDDDAIGIEYVTEYQGYDELTNIVHNHPVPDAVGDVFFDHCNVIQNEIEIAYAYNNGIEDLTWFEEYKLSRTPVVPQDSVIRVDYYLDSKPDEYRIWNYIIGSGEFSELDAYEQYWNMRKVPGIAPLSTTAPFYPDVALRRDTTNIIDTGDEELIADTKKAFAYMTLDLHQTTEDIMSNPDLSDPGDLNDVFLTLAADIKEDDQSTMQYLARLFYSMGVTQGNKKAEYDAWYAKIPDERKRINPPSDQFYIKTDDYTDKIRYNYIDWINVEGVLDDNGSPAKVDYVERSHEIKEEIKGKGYRIDSSILTYKWQYSETHYRIVNISGLQQRTDIWYGKDKRKSKAVWMTMRKTFANEDSEANEHIHVPIHYDTVHQMSIHDKEMVLYKALGLRFISIQHVKIKWYQRGVFKWLVIVVVIVVTLIITGGNPIAAIQTAIATYGIMGALGYLLLNMFVAYVITRVATYIGKEFGLTWLVAIVAVVAAVVMAYHGNFEALANLSNFEIIMTAGQAVLTGYDAHTMQQFKELQKEYKEFQDDKERLEEEIEKIRDGFESDIIVDPLLLSTSKKPIFIDETPQQYYTRTIHQKNLLPRTTKGFVRRKVKLPEVGQDLKTIFMGV